MSSNRSQKAEKPRPLEYESGRVKDKLGVVIGAGSTGIISATIMAERCNLIQIFESTEKIGGVTRDLQGPGNRIFYAGCQYLRPNDFPEDYDMSDLVTFEHRYGSVTEVEGNFVFKNNFAGPAFPDSYFEFDQSIQSDALEIGTKSLRDRLSLYSGPIKSHLLAFAIRVLHKDHLDAFPAYSSTALSLSRVTTLGREIDLILQKNLCSVSDELYGVPRTTLGLEFETAAIPKFGYSKFWNNVIEQLNQRSRVELQLKSKVNQAWSLGDPRISSASEKVWTGDPRFPVRYFTGSKLESISHKKYVTGFFIEAFEGPCLPYYLNVFSAGGSLTRIYIYQLGDELRISLESLTPFSDIESLKNELAPIFEAANIRARLPKQDLTSLLSRQYFPFSFGDASLLVETELKMGENGWRESGLPHWDRASRIRKIKKSFGLNDY